MPTNSTVSSATKVILGCSKCGATLPDEAQFCLKCGKPVSVPLKEPVKIEEPVVQLAPPRVRKRRKLFPDEGGLFAGDVRGIANPFPSRRAVPIQILQRIIPEPHPEPHPGPLRNGEGEL